MPDIFDSSESRITDPLLVGNPYPDLSRKQESTPSLADSISSPGTDIMTAPREMPVRDFVKEARENAKEKPITLPEAPSPEPTDIEQPQPINATPEAPPPIESDTDAWDAVTAYSILPDSPYKTALGNALASCQTRSILNNHRDPIQDEALKRHRETFANVDALARDWTQEPQARERAIKAFGEDFVWQFEQSSEEGRAFLAGMKLLNELYHEPGDGEFDPLMRFMNETGTSGLKGTADAWRHFQTTSAPLHAEEARQHAIAESLSGKAAPVIERMLAGEPLVTALQAAPDLTPEERGFMLENCHADTDWARSLQYLRGWMEQNNLPMALSEDAISERVAELNKQLDYSRQTAGMHGGFLTGELTSKTVRTERYTKDELRARAIEELTEESSLTDDAIVPFARAILKLKKEDYTAYRLLGGLYQLHARRERNEGAAFISPFARTMRNMSESALDAITPEWDAALGDSLRQGIVTTPGAPTLYAVDSSGTPIHRRRSQELAAEVQALRSIQQEIANSPDDAGWWREQFDGLGKLSAQTTFYLATRGLGTFAATSGDRYNELTAAGHGMAESILRGVAAGAAEVLVERIGGESLGKTLRWGARNIPGMRHVTGYFGGVRDQVKRSFFRSVPVRYGLYTAAAGGTEWLEELASPLVQYPMDAGLAALFGSGDGMTWNDVKAQMAAARKWDTLFQMWMMGGIFGAVQLPSFAREAQIARAGKNEIMALTGCTEEDAESIEKIPVPSDKMDAMWKLVKRNARKTDEQIATFKDAVQRMSQDFSGLKAMEAYQAQVELGALPRIEEQPDGTVLLYDKVANDEGRTVELPPRPVSREVAALEVMAKMDSEIADQMEFIQGNLIARATIDSMKSSGKFVFEKMSRSETRETFKRMATAARLRIAEGANPNDTIVGDLNLSPHLTLGQQRDMGDAWEARETIEDARQGKTGSKPTTYHTNAYRVSLDRSRHLIRYVEGKITFDNFMEETLESYIMEHLGDSGHTLDWYAGHLRETQKLLTERGILKNGKKLIREDGKVAMMDIVEAMGELARADVYARIDSLRLPQFIKDFLKWCRTLISYVAHMAELGKAVRELADAGKLDKDFVQTIYDAAGITQEWWADAAMDSTHQTLANIATAAVSGLHNRSGIIDTAAAAWGSTAQQDEPTAPDTPKEHPEAPTDEPAAPQETPEPPTNLPENAVKFAEAMQQKLAERIAATREAAHHDPDADPAATGQQIADLSAQLATWQEFYRYPELMAQASAWDGNPDTLATTEPAVAVDLSGGNSGFSASMQSDAFAEEKELIMQQAIANGEIIRNADGSYTPLAPNGKPSNLTLDQWLTVRTKAFKEWFGDWERKAELTMSSVGTRLRDQEVKDYLTEHAKEEIINLATGITGTIARRQSGKMVSAAAKRKTKDSKPSIFTREQHNYAATRIQSLFKHAIPMGEYEDKTGDLNIMGIRRFACPLNIDGVMGLAFITVKETLPEGVKRADRDSVEPTRKIYTFELEEIKELGGKLNELVKYKRRSSPSSGEMLAQFDAAVKTYFEDVSKVVDENVEPLVVYHYTDEQFSAFDPSMARVNSDIQALFFMDNATDWQDMGERKMACFLNIRKPEEKPMVDARKNEAGRLKREELIAQSYDGTFFTEDGATEWAAFYPEQVKSSTHNRGTFDPNDARISFSLVGENAENWNEIKHLAFEGRDDGRLRVELDASQARIKPDVAARIMRRMAGDRSERKVTFRLADILDYQALFDAYPKLAKMGVFLSDLGARGTRAWYNRGSRNIRINTLNFTLENWDAEALRSTLLHEVQHAIQHIEGFANGNGGSNWDEYIRSAGEIEARAVQKRINMTADERAANPLNDMLEFPGEALANINPPAIEVPFNLVTGAFEQEWGALRRSGNKAHIAFVQNLIAALNKDAERLARYQTLAEDERGDMAVTLLRATNLAKTAAMYLPKGWRIGLKPYLDWMEVFSEVAHHGKLDWSSSAIDPFWEERMQEHLKNMGQAFGWATGDADQAMALLKDYGETRLYMLVNKLLKRVSGQLEEYGKAKLRDKIEEILLSLEPKTRPNRRMQRGVVGKEAFDEIMKLVELMHYDEKEYQEAHNNLVGELTKKAANEAPQEERETLDNKLLELEVYGCIGIKSLDELDRLYTCLVRHIRGEKEAWKALHEARQQRRRELAEGIIAGVKESKGETAMEQKSIAAAYANLNGKGQKKSWLRVGASAAVRAMESLPQLLSVLAQHKGTAALAEDIRMRLANAGKDLGIREKYHDKLFRTWFAQAFGLPTKGVKANFAIDKAIVAFNATKDLDIRLKEYEKKNLRLPLELALMRISGEDTAELRAELEAKLADLQARLMQENGGLPLSEQDKADIARAREIQEMPAIAITPHESLDKNGMKEVFREIGEVTNKNNGRKVKFPSASAGKILAHQGFKAGAIVRKFGELFESSILAFELPEIRMEGHKYHSNHERYENYVNKFSVNGESYYIRFTVPIIRNSKPPHNVHSSAISEVEVYKEGDSVMTPRNTAGSGSLPSNGGGASTLYPANAPGSSSSLPVDKKLAAFFESVNAKIKQSQALPPNLETDKAIKEAEKRLAALDMELDAQDIDALLGWFALNPAARRAAEILRKPAAERTPDELSVINKTFKKRHVDLTYNRFMREQQTPLNLSKNSALYHILAYEQEDNRARMEVQGWTADVINRLREYVGKEGLKLGELMREHLNTVQRARIAAIFERENGIPFANIPNYFPLRFMRADKELQDFDMAAMLDGMSGGMGGGLTGFLAQRTDNHDLPLAINLGATSVWRDAVATSEYWIQYQDIIADLRGVLGHKGVMDALTVQFGKGSVSSLRDWVRAIEQMGRMDSNARCELDIVASRAYNAGAVAILAYRVETLIKQFSGVLNAWAGDNTLTFGDWLRGMEATRSGTGRMSMGDMLGSDYIQSRIMDGDDVIGKMLSRMGDDGSFSAFERLAQIGMTPLSVLDAGVNAIPATVLFNAHFARAKAEPNPDGSKRSDKEAEAIAWTYTVAAMEQAAQPLNNLQKSWLGAKLSTNFAGRMMLFMMSESFNKIGLTVSLLRQRRYGKAATVWLAYGTINSIIGMLLDYMKDEPEDWEERDMTGYIWAALFGGLSGMPLVSEGLEYMLKQLGADIYLGSSGRGLIDARSTFRSVGKFWNMATDDEEHEWKEWMKECSRLARTGGIVGGFMGGLGSFFLFFAGMMNPLRTALNLSESALLNGSEDDE